MVLRKEKFQNNIFYHIVNNSIDSKKIFLNKEDFSRFLLMIKTFKNKKEVSHSQNNNNKEIEIIAYALMNNHFHLILKQTSTNGISNFMQRLSTGYTMYFNKKYKRKGSIFVGRFKSERIKKKNLDLLIIYLNLNYFLHKKKIESFKLINPEDIIKDYFTSEEEYMWRNNLKICNKNYILEDTTVRKFKIFSREKIEEIKKKKVIFLEL